MSGNNQILEPGVASTPLVFRQEGNYVNVPPVAEVQFTLTVVGDAVFASNGLRSLTTSAPLLPVAGAAPLYTATVPNTRIVSGFDGGAIAVSVQSQLCSTVTAPSQFSAFGNVDPGSPQKVFAVQGDGAVVAPGQEVLLRARVDFGEFGQLDRPLGGKLSVIFQIASGDGRFANGSSSISVPVGNSGEVSAVVRAGSVEGRLRIEANGTGFDSPPAQFNITVQRTRTVVLVSGNNQVGRPGAASQPLVLEVRDAGGRPVADATVTWGVGFGVGPVLDATTTVTDGSGRTQNSFVFGPNSVESVIVATLAGGENLRFLVIAAFGGITILSGDGQSGAIGSNADQPIVFEVIDSSGRPAIGQRVEFSVLRGSAALTASSDIVNERGQASARFRYGSSPGLVSIQASAFNGQFTAVANANGFAAGAAAVSGNNQQGAPRSTLPQPLVVQLSQPPAGATAAKGLAGVVVSWAVTAGGGTLANATSITDSTGRASNQWTLGPAAGTNTVRADVPGSTSVQFNATAVETVPSGSVLEISAGNNQVLATGAPSAPLVVRLRTAAGAAVAGATVQWRVAPAINGATNPATSVTNAAGEASTVATLGLPGDAQVTATLVGIQNPPTVTFNLNGGVQNIAGLSPGQQEVGNAIDKACPALFQQSQSGALTAAQQDLLARCSELVGNAGDRPTEVATALSQMLNEEVAAQDDAAFSTTGAQFDNLKARIAALRSGTQGASLGGLALAGSGGALPLSFLPSAIVADDGNSEEVGNDFSRWGFFASGTIGRGDRDDDGDSLGYEFDTYGLTAGIDYRYSDKLVFGGALGYTDNSTDVNGDQGSLETQGYSASFYGTWYQGDAWFADAVLTWGRNTYDLSRRVHYQIRGNNGSTQSIDQVATASPDGNQLQFALSAGRDFNRGAWAFGPYARLTTTRIDFDGYIERMSSPGAAGGGLAMAVEDRRLESLEGVLGGKASYTMSTSWGILISHVQIEALHEFEDDPEAIVSRFANDPTGTSITIAPDEVDTDYFNIGLGLSGVFADGRSAFLYYERRAGQRDFSQDNLAIGVRIEF